MLINRNVNVIQRVQAYNCLISFSYSVVNVSDLTYCRSPNNPNQKLIKRIIAVEGDTVK